MSNSRKPNQVAARNSLDRRGLVCSGLSFALATFAAGAHPAVRELVHSAMRPNSIR